MPDRFSIQTEALLARHWSRTFLATVPYFRSRNTAFRCVCKKCSPLSNRLGLRRSVRNWVASFITDPITNRYTYIGRPEVFSPELGDKPLYSVQMIVRSKQPVQHKQLSDTVHQKQHLKVNDINWCLFNYSQPHLIRSSGLFAMNSAGWLMKRGI